MFSTRLAQTLLASTVALAGLTALTGTAAAQTTEPVDCLILSLQHGDNNEVDPQILLAREPVACPTGAQVTSDLTDRDVVYARMQVVAGHLAEGCGTFQVDLTATHETWTTWPLGTPFTADVPSWFLSAIPDIAGVGVCDTTPPAETTTPTTEATAPVTETLPPANPTPTVDIGRDGSAPGISVVKVTSTPVALAATGASAGTLALLGGFVAACGALVVALSRRTI